MCGQCDSACLHNEPIGTTLSRVHGDIDLWWNITFLYYHIVNYCLPFHLHSLCFLTPVQRSLKSSAEFKEGV